MRSRATFTRDRMPAWKTWLLQDYARYWYGFGVILLLVLGVAELARLGAPLGSLQIAGLFLLGVVVIAAGFAGYVALWRRESDAAQWMFHALSRLRPAPGDSPGSHPPVAPDGEGEAEVPDGRA